MFDRLEKSLQMLCTLELQSLKRLRVNTQLFHLTSVGQYIPQSAADCIAKDSFYALGKLTFHRVKSKDVSASGGHLF